MACVVLLDRMPWAPWFKRDRMFQSRHTVPSVSVVSPDLDPTSALVLVPKVTIGGLPIAIIDRASSARLMVEAALARRTTGHPPLIVTSANGQVVSTCAHDQDIRAQFLNFDVIHADGMPLVFSTQQKS